MQRFLCKRDLHWIDDDVMMSMIATASRLICYLGIEYVNSILLVEIAIGAVFLIVQLFTKFIQHGE